MKTNIILENKIDSYVCSEIERIEYLDGLDFIIEDMGYDYQNGDVICVENISYSYDNISLINNEINGQLNNGVKNRIVNLLPINNVNSSFHHTEYKGTIRNICCKDESNCCSKLIEKNLNFYIENLVISIEGNIGCLPFKANYTYNGPIS